MAISDPIGDMLARIRNAESAGERAVMCPASKLRKSVLEVLEREGYIRGFGWSEVRSGIPEFTIELKYDEGAPVIKEITRVSKRGRRVYSKIKDLPKGYRRLRRAILSTPGGRMPNPS